MTTVYIQTRVRREILRDEANKYSEAQVVKADTSLAVKAQMDDTAKDTTKSNKTATGVALLKEVFDNYGPEDFFSATLNSKIQYDRKTKKPVHPDQREVKSGSILKGVSAESA